MAPQICMQVAPTAATALHVLGLCAIRLFCSADGAPATSGCCSQPVLLHGATAIQSRLAQDPPNRRDMGAVHGLTQRPVCTDRAAASRVGGDLRPR
jgi:hypothetical protein